MVEAAANSVEDFLVDSLSFKLKPGASYINERKSVTYHTVGSNYYSPSSGTKLIKILVSGDAWMDPSTFRVMFDLVNDGGAGTELRVLGGPHTFFKRLRVLCNGAIVEDIDDYNRVSEMFSIMTSADARLNDAAEAFGNSLGY